jgi:hypothetical protein
MLCVFRLHVGSRPPHHQGSNTRSIAEVIGGQAATALPRGHNVMCKPHSGTDSQVLGMQFGQCPIKLLVHIVPQTHHTRHHC